MSILKEEFPVEAMDFVTAGEASAQIKRLLKKLGVDPGVIRRLSIACYEAEINLVIHSDGGKLTLEMNPENVSLISEDVGPGIPDIDLAMSEGYSTASDDVRMMGFGAGMGLANMARNADRFHIDSKVGEGTRIEMIFDINK
ncbi:MAG: anti-sigma regulatory factor [Clostridia bacterium]|nr:anti-sigma regulatory factor [Clostridia bacterium]MBQ4452083.1 anti-sigma regulatory factor [Clostridia bacterium]MBR5380400.1 anti-sigma regulatory factor [Clostridia bacterium]MBR5752306.1 anti-sigma regulatory factor [Clostridia bacterium]